KLLQAQLGTRPRAQAPGEPSRTARALPVWMTAPRPTGTSAGPPRGRGPAWERPGARPAQPLGRPVRRPVPSTRLVRRPVVELAQFVLRLLEPAALGGRQLVSGAVDVEAQHRHR